MSKINELIQTLCPDGVEWKHLYEVTVWDKRFNSVERYKQLTVIDYKKYFLGEEQKQLVSDGGSVKILTTYASNLYADENSVADYITDGEIVCIPWGGNAIVQYYKGKFVTGDNRIATSLDVNVLSNKYLYYMMQCNLHLIASFYRGSGIKHPDMSKVLDILIPVPPLPVQDEIVRILDEYTDLEAELEAKLSEEIKLKQKQYEVYRDELLTFGDDVEYKKLGEVATISRGNGFQKKDFTEVGRPCIHYGQIFMHYSKMGITTSKTLTCIDDDKYEKNAKALPNDIVMAVTSENVEDVCKCVVWEGDEPVAVSGHTAIFHTEMNSKFLAYWFGSSDFYVQKVRLAHGTKVIEVTPAVMVDIVLPVPSLTEQERIVKILDKYDTYTRDMISTLNTELESRKKQYAYYRDQLLTFKRKE